VDLIEDELKKIFDSEEIAITGILVIHPDGHKEFVPDEKDVDLDGRKISIREVIEKKPEPIKTIEEEAGIWRSTYGTTAWKIITTDGADVDEDHETWASTAELSIGSYVWNTSDTVTTTDCSMVYALTDGTVVHGDLVYEKNS